MDRSWSDLAQRFWRGALDVLFPPRALCPGCQRPNRQGGLMRPGLCRSCLTRLPLVAPPICARCGRPLRGGDLAERHDPPPAYEGSAASAFSVVQLLPSFFGLRHGRPKDRWVAGSTASGADELCRTCRTMTHLFTVARAPGVYDGALRDYIHRVKFGADRALGEALGTLLAEFAVRTRELWPADAVVPIPLHPQRLEERGFNQAEVLARAVAARAERPLLPHVLERVRPTTAQARLPVESRQANVRGAFRVREAALLAGKRLLLVDDVLTSGATAGEAARVLLRAGATQVNVLCLAVGVYEADWLARQRNGSAAASPGRTTAQRGIAEGTAEARDAISPQVAGDSRRSSG